jgi:hypothetical protein
VYRAFPPSHEALVAQNRLADQLGLNRFFDDSDLNGAVERGEMVPIQESQYVTIAHTLPADRRLVRPWVNDFLQDLGQKFYAQYHQPIQVNSAVRTYLVQVKLRRWNHNAAPVEGESASSHMTGATVDLQRRGLSKKQIRFLEWELLYPVATGKVIEEEETSCFHTMIAPKRREIPVIYSDDIRLEIENRGSSSSILEETGTAKVYHGQVSSINAWHQSWVYSQYGHTHPFTVARKRPSPSRWAASVRFPEPQV